MSRRFVSGILLAAGSATRFGGERPKQLAPFRGEPLVRRAARQALAAGLDEVIVVVGRAAGEVAAAVAGLAVRIAENPRFAEGRSTSIATGLSAVSPRAAAAIFLPCDQPFLTSLEISRLADAYRDGGGPIVVPTCGGRRGSPVTFDRSLFAELAALSGDRGGRVLVERYPERVVEVPLASEVALVDADTPEALAELAAQGEE